MEATLNEIVEWIFTLSPLSIYFVFFLIAYLENIIPPVPGDVLVAFGGYLAAEQLVSFSLLLGLTTIASVVGFMTMYAIGNHWGYKIEHQREKFWLMRFIDVKYFDKGKRWMERWGQGAILANRFLAGTRSVISITAGIYRTKVWTTVLSCSVSSVLWNFILLMLGWIVHENWYVIGEYLNVYGQIVLVLIILAVAARFGYIFWKRRKAGRETKNL
jgi:membrane protein DedA with SNARE-associated domain